MKKKMTTVVNITKRTEYDIFIGRPSKWGNPFRLADYGNDRKYVLRLFTDWINRPEQAKLKADGKAKLRGQRIGCFCEPEDCHGHVWAAICDGKE